MPCTQFGCNASAHAVRQWVRVTHCAGAVKAREWCVLLSVLAKQGITPPPHWQRATHTVMQVKQQTGTALNRQGRQGRRLTGHVDVLQHPYHNTHIPVLTYLPACLHAPLLSPCRPCPACLSLTTTHPPPPLSPSPPQTRLRFMTALDVSMCVWALPQLGVAPRAAWRDRWACITCQFVT